ncbi:MAG: 50S ribosomal protein L9 [Lachnospiraceae bacterium]|nr:50S ribosomal protein L9 [Lachnospiraceae bacterium]
MKIILLQDVKKLGKKGDIVDISDGYARNFVLPKKLGVEASKGNLTELKNRKAKQEKEEAEAVAAAKELAERLKESSVTVKIKAGKDGKAFGAVPAEKIAEAAKSQLGIELDRRKIVMDEPLKVLGEYDVNVKLYANVSGTLKVYVEDDN